jgi:hypothetical protein
MPPHFETAWFIFYLLFCGSLIWCWAVWLKSKPETFRSWRAAALLGGLVCATVSTALSCYLYVHAMYTGGYPIHMGFKDGYSGFHPVELLCIQLGAVTALVGVVCTSTGKGTGRMAVRVIAILNLLGWFVDAMAL